jgi:hypothetical protein
MPSLTFRAMLVGQNVDLDVSLLASREVPEDHVEWAASRAEAVRCADEIHDPEYLGVRR